MTTAAATGIGATVATLNRPGCFEPVERQPTAVILYYGPADAGQRCRWTGLTASARLAGWRVFTNESDDCVKHDAIISPPGRQCPRGPAWAVPSTHSPRGDRTRFPLLSAVLTYHNDNPPHGSQLQRDHLDAGEREHEHIWQIVLLHPDGSVYAQPLVVPGVNILAKERTMSFMWPRSITAVCV